MWDTIQLYFSLLLSSWGKVLNYVGSWEVSVVNFVFLYMSLRLSLNSSKRDSYEHFTNLSVSTRHEHNVYSMYSHIIFLYTCICRMPLEVMPGHKNQGAKNDLGDQPAKKCWTNKQMMMMTMMKEMIRVTARRMTMTMKIPMELP